MTPIWMWMTYAFMLGMVSGVWLQRRYWRGLIAANLLREAQARPEAKPAQWPMPAYLRCSECSQRPDPRCGAGSCPRHCMIYCPPGCRDGAEAASRATALLTRYGPLEKEKSG